MKKVIFCVLIMSATLSGCFKDEFSSLELTVVDQAGLPVEAAEITLHETKTDWAEYLNEVQSPTVRTDENGKVLIKDLPDGKYFVNIKKENKPIAI
jgi:hypothetical protein